MTGLAEEHSDLSTTDQPLGSFSFKTIGKPPILLSRLTFDSTPTDPPQVYSPSPPSSPELKKQIPKPPRHRPTLIEALAPNEADSTPAATLSGSSQPTQLLPSSLHSQPQPINPLHPSASSKVAQEPFTLSTQRLSDPTKRVSITVTTPALTQLSPLAPLTTSMTSSANQMDVDPPATSSSQPPRNPPQVPPHLSPVITSDLYNHFTELTKERADWDEVRNLRQRFRDEHQEFLRRHEDTCHAVQREKDQADRVFAAAESALLILDRLHARQELRWSEEQRLSERTITATLSARVAGLPEPSHNIDSLSRPEDQVSDQDHTQMISHTSPSFALTLDKSALKESLTVPAVQGSPPGIRESSVSEIRTSGIAIPPVASHTNGMTEAAHKISIPDPDAEAREEKKRAEEYKALRAAVMAEKQRANAENAERIRAQRELEEKIKTDASERRTSQPPSKSGSRNNPPQISSAVVQPLSGASQPRPASVAKPSPKGIRTVVTDEPPESTSTVSIASALTSSFVEPNSQLLPARLKRKASLPMPVQYYAPKPIVTPASSEHLHSSPDNAKALQPYASEVSTTKAPLSPVKNSSVPSADQRAFDSVDSSHPDATGVKTERSPSIDWGSSYRHPTFYGPSSHEAGVNPVPLPSGATPQIQVALPSPSPSPPICDPGVSLRDSPLTPTLVSDVTPNIDTQWVEPDAAHTYSTPYQGPEVSDTYADHYFEDPMVNSPVTNRRERSPSDQERSWITREQANASVRSAELHSTHQQPSSRQSRKRPLDDDSRHWEPEQSLPFRRRVSEAGDRSYQQPDTNIGGSSSPVLPLPRITTSWYPAPREYDSYRPSSPESPHYGTPWANEMSGTSQSRPGVASDSYASQTPRFYPPSNYAPSGSNGIAETEYGRTLERRIKGTPTLPSAKRGGASRSRSTKNNRRPGTNVTLEQRISKDTPQGMAPRNF